MLSSSWHQLLFTQQCTSHRCNTLYLIGLSHNNATWGDKAGNEMPTVHFKQSFIHTVEGEESVGLDAESCTLTAVM